MVDNPDAINPANASRSASAGVGLRPGFDGGNPSRRIARRTVDTEHPTWAAISSAVIPAPLKAANAARSFKIGSGCDGPLPTPTTVPLTRSQA
jgi:hypothetical protein